MSNLILVVDDEETVAETVERALRRSGMDVIVVHRGADALQVARTRQPALILLDIMMPGMNGIEVCRHLRANPSLRQIPILFLTARGEIADKIEGFEAGADDYLTKPFDLREMELRVKALLRRAQGFTAGAEPECLEVGNLVLNCRTYEISTPRCTTLLTPVEFELLHFMMSHAGRIFSADQLLQEVWGYPPGTGMPDLVRVHIKNVRDKIEPNPREPLYVRNILRRGYMIASDVS